MRGRKKKQESRAQEIRARLLVWKQSPESLRPSMRALARELSTSHQLVRHYLDGLEEWEFKERYQRAKEKAQKKAAEIRARAEAEGREMTMRECLDAMVTPRMHDQIERIRQDARRGPLHPGQFKILKLLAKRGFPGAQEVLQKCALAGLKKRKRFAAIVKDTPRHEGEPFGAWVRRIWDECDKYDTTIPTVVTEELLERYARGNAKSGNDNLPPIPSKNAKSFRSDKGDTGNSANLEGRRNDAVV
ncbi:MAG: hypothetical protein WAK48_19815 [Candidatus Acidiferrum sp.]